MKITTRELRVIIREALLSEISSTKSPAGAYPGDLGIQTPVDTQQKHATSSQEQMQASQDVESEIQNVTSELGSPNISPERHNELTHELNMLMRKRDNLADVLG
jgi:hypothetical protein